MDIAQGRAHDGQAVGVTQRLGEADAFLAMADALRELSLVGEHIVQIEAGHHGGKSGEAKSFPAQIPFEQPKDFQEKILGASIVPRPEAGPAEVEISCHLQRNIPERLGNSLGALAEPERLRGMPSHIEVVAHIDG
jgi:hypothetical protein